MQREHGDPHVLAQALEYTRLGVPVLPVGVNKRPRGVETWKARQNTLPSEEQIEREFSSRSVVGLGIVLGSQAAKASAQKKGTLAVLDLELALSMGRLLDAAKLHSAEQKLGESGGGGRHLYIVSEKTVRNSEIRDRETGEHLGDVKGEGGYIIAPPSLHASGRRYRWISTAPALRVPDLGAWLRPLGEELGWSFREKPDSEDPAPRGDHTPIAALLLEDCPEGRRNTTLTSIAGWARNVMQKSEAMAVCLSWNQSHCQPPLDAHVVTEMVDRFYAQYGEPPKIVLRSEDESDNETRSRYRPRDVPEVCWRGWFKEYRDVMGPTTEAPDIYHLACALIATGTVLGRTCWNHLSRKIYPNPWFVLIGQSGRNRKDTALSRAFDVMRPHDLMPANYSTLAAISSAEGLIEKLGKAKEPLLVHLSEFSTLLRNCQRESTSNLMTYLTQLFDSPDEIQLATRQKPVVAENVFMTMIGATTPDWLSDDLTTPMIRGGLAGRFMYLAGEPKPPIPRPPQPDPVRLRAMRVQLYRIARALKSLHGELGLEVKLSPAAEDWWDTFYLSEAEQPYQDDEFQILSQRVPMHIRKIALLYAVMEEEDTINTEHLEAAAALVRLSQEHVQENHRRWGGSVDAKLRDQITDFLEEQGGAAWPNQIHKRVSGRVRANELRAVFGSMVTFRVLRWLKDGRIALASYRDENRTNGKYDAE